MAKYQDVLELVDKVSQPLKKINNNMQKVSAIAKKTTKAIAGISAGIMAVGGAIVAGANKVADYGDRIDKMSQKIGMSRKSFQEWDYIMSQNGGSVDNLQMGYKTLTTQIGNAQKGSKDTVKAFQTLGIKIKDNNGQLRSSDAVFNDAIKSLQKMTNQTQRNIIGNKLFGRSYAELLPLINQSADATDKLREKANKKGLILSDKDIDNAVKYKDAMDTFSRFFEAKFATVMMSVMPSITQGLEEIVKLTEDNQDLLNNIGISMQWLFTTAIPAIVKSIGFVVNAFKVVAGVVGDIIGFIVSIPDNISMAFNTAKTNIMIFFLNIKKQVMEIIKLIQSIFNIGGNLGKLFNGVIKGLGSVVNNSSNNTTNNNQSYITNNNTTNNYGLGMGSLIPNVT